MKALIRAIPLISNQKMNIKQYSDILMTEIFNLGDTFQNNEQMLELICRSFIEIAENYYDCIELYLDKISVFTFIMISSKIERLKLMGFEFWCRIGSEELDRFKLKNNKKNCKFYFQTYFEKLKNIIDMYIYKYSNDENDDEWNVSKASCYLLVILVQVINQESYEEIINSIKGKNNYI